MKRKCFFYLLMGLLTLIFYSKGISEEISYFKEDEILLKFHSDVQIDHDEFFSRNKLKVISIFPEVQIYQCQVKSRKNILKIIRKLKKENTISFVEPNHKVRLVKAEGDPFLSFLWNIENFGQSGGLPGADIKTVDAWSLLDEPAVSPPIVAIIDTGINYRHWDLQDNIWTNPNEIPNNKIDDDGNGYIDDIRGWDFVNNDNDPIDDNAPIYHGTHIAGTIGAIHNNGIAIQGVAKDVRLMALKSFNPEGWAYISDVLKAIIYATQTGAKIVNASWGTWYPSEVLREGIVKAGEKGVIFVAAAGNDGLDSDFYPIYPAAFDLTNIISVAATDHRDELAAFSNYGLRSVHIAAPGVKIFSTVGNQEYSWLSGTSMAVPHVCGIIALMLGIDSDLSIDSVRDFLFNTVDPLPSLTGKIATGGRVNAFRAVEAVKIRKVPKEKPKMVLPEIVKKYLYWWLPRISFSFLTEGG